MDVEAIEKKVGMTYDDVQRDAIRQAATAKVCDRDKQEYAAEGETALSGEIEESEDVYELFD